jgi:uncharacterized protein YhbP (UPF0306 family)
MTIERSRRPVAAERIVATARRLLRASTLCAIATATPAGRAHVNTAYFAWTDGFDLVWLSDPSAGHSRNVRANPSVAIAVHGPSQTWGGPDRGIQLFGTAREPTGRLAREAERVYGRRFADYHPEDAPGYRLYRLRTRRMKLFDERTFGAGVFVTATIRSGGVVAWERTDVSRPG